MIPSWVKSCYLIARISLGRAQIGCAKLRTRAVRAAWAHVLLSMRKPRHTCAGFRGDLRSPLIIYASLQGSLSIRPFEKAY